MMRLFISLIFLFISIKADGELPPHLLPNDAIKTNKHKHHGHTPGRKTKTYKLINLEDIHTTDIKYILSNLEEKEIKSKPDKIKLPRSMFDNYHVLVTNSETKDKSSTAVFYIYKHGRPSKTSPTKLTSIKKGSFEIQPNPLPREHDRYYASKEYQFILKFDNKPLANQLINLNTLNGTKKKIFTDDNGEFRLTLPNDFKDVKKGRRSNPPSYYILSSTFEHTNKKYTTSFTNPYHVNPNDYWSSIPAGFGVAVLGLGVGLFILWRRKNG